VKISRRIAVGLLLTGTVASVSPVSVVEAATAATKLTAKVKGVAAGTQLLAVYSTGASARAKVSGGKATITLPKNVKASGKVSLHLVNPNGSYGGPVSIGKTKGKKTTWYGSVSARPKKTTSLGTITYSAAQQYASTKAAGSTAALPVTGTLKNASKAGKPAGAGRLGLAASKAVSSASLAPGDSIEWTWGVQAFAAAEQPAGGDLDGDGMPNTLDIDDDGDGFPDQLDQSAGKAGAKPTALYDAFSSLTTGIGSGQSAINYNILSQKYTDAAELRKQLSILVDANFTLNTRVVAPFLTDNSSLTIQDAWVDCTGLAWCLTTDSGDTLDTFVSAPRILSWGDGNIRDYWSYAFRKTGQNTCSVYQPASSTEGCQSVKWADFSMHKMLTTAKANGGSMPATAPAWTDHTGGFGLYDAYREYPAGWGPNKSGFDLTANVQPRGYTKFLDNFKAGDVLTVKATLSDGTATEISMTVAPFFVTAPTVFSFTPGGGSEQTVDYVTAESCNGTDQPGCRLGSESRRVRVSAANPKLTVKFWRPQRMRVSGADDAIAGTDPYLDMGSLNYRVSGYSGDGGQWGYCFNSAVTISDTASSTFTEVKADPQYSNSFDYYKDGSADAAPSAGRYVTATIDFSKCKDISVTAGKNYTFRLDASGEELFGGSRTNANQNFNITFTS
jgi:hypothetical protein